MTKLNIVRIAAGIIIAMIAGVTLPAAAQTAGHQAAKPAAASAATAVPTAAAGATVKVNGLVCDFCVQAITRTFQRQKAVSRVHVDLDAKEIHLGFKPGQTMPDATIRDLVTRSGYNVVAIDRSGAAS